jgi:hypothetical protein
MGSDRNHERLTAPSFHHPAMNRIGVCNEQLVTVMGDRDQAT